MNETPLRIGVLAQMAKSPAHCKYALEHETPATRTMNLGTLTHAILLGKNMPVVYGGGARRGKEWTAFKESHPEGTEIFLDSELELARQLAGSLMQHPEAYRLLLGRREETITWGIGGRSCRGTPDVFNTTTGVLADLKTTVDASPRAFSYQALRLAYHAKLAWYLDGLNAAKIGSFDRAYIVAIENKPPFAVGTFQLTERALDFGRKLYSTWLERFLVYERSAVPWPGYLPEVLDAPEEALELSIDGEMVEV